MTAYERGNTPFLAWDGEGWSDGNGEHSYMLLAVSTGEYVAAPRLSSWKCLDFIVQMGARYKKAIHIIYGGGYDVTHILRDVPLEDRQILRSMNECNIRTPSHWAKRNKYHIEYIPHKWFTVTGYDHNTRKRVRVKIYDIMTFFQMSAVKAWESRDIPVPEHVKSGKAARADFTWDDFDEVLSYCMEELSLYVQLANTLRNEFKEAGMNISEWHGPGAVASALFKKHRIKEHMQRPPLEVERALQRAYFGGRFEQFKAGHYEGKVYVYDINSAYPDKLRNLPSLRGATWEWSDSFDGSLGIWNCGFEKWSQDPYAPNPLPWRGKSGNVGFPDINRSTWLWTPEAINSTEVRGGWKLQLANNIKPFSFIADMFETRKVWKAQQRGGEKALKLGMNSGYGKTAQRIGGREDNGFVPAWHQLEWAGMITSYTRAQIWDAVSLAPESIIAVETDSVASTVPLDLDMGTGLGQWEYTEYDSITYLQSGIYFTEDMVHGGKIRTRGIDVRQLDHKTVLEYLSQNGEGELLVHSRDFIGITNPRTYLYGQWQDSVKSVRTGGGKRIHDSFTCPECAAGRSMAETMHPLTANVRMGHSESAAHPLPWLDGMDDFEEDTAEGARLATEAVADWEKERIAG